MASELAVSAPAERRRTWPVLATTALLVALAAIPALGNSYLTYMACLVGINVIGTVGLNVTVGYAGLLSIGHSAFIGVGAYVYALLWMRGVPLPLCIVASGVAAFAVGLLFGTPALRIRGVYLAIATLAAQYTLYFVFQRWEAVTGGDRGLSPPAPVLLRLPLDTDARQYWLILSLAALLCLAAHNLFRTRVGRSFIAVRERDYAAQVLGVNVTRTKLLAFGIGAAYAGVAGALTALFLRIVNPDQFVLSSSVFFLTAVIVGGRGSVVGSVLGAAFMTLIPEVLRAAGDGLGSHPGSFAAMLSPLRELVFGALIVGFLLLDQRGLVGLLQRLGLRVDYRG